ncbi:hypothetical protein PR202_gb09671 [Eleusine coracana subsp. coracana]|uniref:Uncharacterized protein n=1 Tax=Eleusine coracana subsp. coracana TaxID=191504 RepID=A0AAV5EIF2_ELECO|nr:hypothetical protein PR202_gb09671 [Eleusine coracana subsp. coracana]
MLPFLDLVALLAARGLSVTIAVTAGNAALVNPLVAAYPSAVGAVVLPFPPSPLLPAGCGENTKDLPAGHLIRPFMVALAALRAPLLAWCKAHVITAVLSDFFTGWTQPLAAELGVPHVLFSPSSAFYLAMTGHLWCHLPRRRCDADDDEEEIISFPEIPGSPSLPWRHLSSLFRKHVPGDEVSESIRQFFLWNQDSACVVINTFAALEAAYLQTTPPRMLAVGPLSEAVDQAAHVDDRGGKPAVPAAELTAWLDAHAEGSVLYVSFGTQHAMSPAHAACVADALARSSAAFVWAVRRGAPVPEGFETATATRARGLVIRGWAPQSLILRHRAVGWFLTHCGWNSVLEAAAAGVAMLTWPVGADQFTDAWQVAEAGVAVPVAEGADDLPDVGEVAKAIDVAMGSEGNHVRERAVELSRKAAAAVAEGGSSHRDLEELVRILTTVV